MIRYFSERRTRVKHLEEILEQYYKMDYCEFNSLMLCTLKAAARSTKIKRLSNRDQLRYRGLIEFLEGLREPVFQIAEAMVSGQVTGISAYYAIDEPDDTPKKGAMVIITSDSFLEPLEIKQGAYRSFYGGGVNYTSEVNWASPQELKYLFKLVTQENKKARVRQGEKERKEISESLAAAKSGG